MSDVPPQPAAAPGPRQQVIALGGAQTIAWASSFYLPVMLAAPVAAQLALPPSTLFALLTLALVIAALASPRAGRLIDRHGGRPVLAASNALFIGGLALMALAGGGWAPAMLVAAWVLLGLAMAAGLYDAAFATLVRLHGAQARRAITGITLIAGFASTVGWPLTAWMEARWGWRGACWGWAALHLLVALPLNLWLPRATPTPPTSPTSPSPPAAAGTPPAALPAGTPPPPGRLRLAQVALLFTLMSVVSTAVATHLPALLQAGGVPMAGAVALAALAGPAQVVARLLELGWLSRRPPLWTARAATLGHPLGAACLLLAGPAGALPFVVLHGLGNGLLTIVRGTLPLALFGAQGYGARQGWLSMPGRVLGAFAPWGMGVALQAFGAGALAITAACGAGAVALLAALAPPATADARPAPG